MKITENQWRTIQKGWRPGQRQAEIKTSMEEVKATDLETDSEKNKRS
jgi:hypothetical protein